MSSRSPWEVPESWAWTPAGDIADVVGGGTPTTSDMCNFEGGKIPWITPADLSGYTEKLISEGARNITDHGLKNSGAKLMPKGTVLFSSRAPIGYVAIAANPVCTNQGFKSFVLPDGIIPSYMYWYLRRAKDLAVALASGTTFLEISGKKAMRIPVPIAPTGEQRRIVETIEALLTKLDAAIVALKRVKANLKRYRTSVLKAACEGRLVPTEAELARKEGRQYETGEQLLARILQERRAKWEADQLARMLAAGKLPKDDGWKKKYKEPKPPDISNLSSLPEGWVWTTLETVADVIDPNPSHRVPKYCENGVPFLSSESFLEDNTIDFSIGRRVSKDILSEQVARFHLNDGAFAMSRYGTIGRTCGLPTARNYCLSYAVVVIQSALSLVDNDFLRIVCSSSAVTEIARSRVQSVAIPDLGIAHIRSLPIPVAPLSHQRHVVGEAERKMSVSAEITHDIERQLVRADRLRQSILKRAFEGTLVPQDPNDEPASLLLERIRAERAAAMESNHRSATRSPKRKAAEAR